MRNESHRCSALRRAEDQNVSIPSVSSHILPSLFSYLHSSLACTPLLTQTRTSITMMEQYDHYSTFEVDGSHIPELAPDATQPEAINVGEKKVASWSPMRTAEEKISTVARSRATYIWIALLSLILIAIAVGVGVGVTQHKRSEQSNSEAEKSATYQHGLSSTTRLAATNYTDAQGGEHSQVYYQDKSLDIWMADWNGSSRSWTTSPVLPKDNTSVMYPKNGTPIAAYNQWSIYNTEVCLSLCFAINTLTLCN